MARSVESQSDADRLRAVARDEALSLSEDDVTGLWELLWGVRSECPDVSHETAMAASVSVLEGLIERGCIRLVWWNPEDDSDQQVDTASATQLVRDPRRWTPPSDLRTSQLRFIATGSPACSPKRM
jgi:hypothetical protein